MRIISGKYKGRRITAPKKLPVRPTTDLAKESLFNIINNEFYIDKVILLDLFSGTGNISYEFASRGCTQITAIDADYGCTEFIRKTAEEFDFDINVIKSDVFKFLERTKLKSKIIFADPPYNFSDEKFAQIRQLVFEKNLLVENGYLIIEHSEYTNLEHLEHFSFFKKYGSCVFSFFERTLDKPTKEDEEE